MGRDHRVIATLHRKMEATLGHMRQMAGPIHPRLSCDALALQHKPEISIYSIHIELNANPSFLRSRLSILQIHDDVSNDTGERISRRVSRPDYTASVLRLLGGRARKTLFIFDAPHAQCGVENS
jgi:hypothetical protein